MPLPGYGPFAPDGTVEKTSGKGLPSSPTDINPVRSLDDIALVGSQILNQGNVAEGSTAPPQQAGQFRVPLPTGFKIVRIQQNFVGILATLSWQDVDPSRSDIALYELYAQDAYKKNQEPTLVGSATKSPCITRVICDAASDMTFWLRPVLSSGLALPLSACPTTTGHSPGPTINTNGGTITTGTVTMGVNQLTVGVSPNDVIITNSVSTTAPITFNSVIFVKVTHNGVDYYMPLWGP